MMIRAIFWSGLFLILPGIHGMSQQSQPSGTQAASNSTEKPGGAEKKPVMRLYDVTAPQEARMESPEEVTDYLNITQAKDPQQRVQAIEEFLQKYPQSIHFNRIHQWAVFQYQELNEIDKMISHGEIAMPAYGEDPSFLSTMALAYTAKGIPQRSIELGEKAIGLLEKATMPSQAQADQWNAERNRLLSISKAAVGSAWVAKFDQVRTASKTQAAAQENAASAGVSTASSTHAGNSAAPASQSLPVEFLDKGERLLMESLQLASQYDYALFQLGILYVYKNQAAKAIDVFAKAVAAEGGFARPSRQNLEYIYKLTHNNSLEGLDQVIARAKAALSSEPATVPADPK